MKKLTAQLLSALILCSLTLSADATPLYWDSDATAAGNDASTPAGLGGAGTWNTSNVNWWDGVSGSDQAWVNANADQAVFRGTAAFDVTQSGASAQSLTFSNSSGNVRVLGGTFTIATNSTGFFCITNATGSSNLLGSIIAGPAANYSGIYVTGGGQIRFTNNNTYTNIFIDGGTLVVDNDKTSFFTMGPIPAAAVNNYVTIQNGGTLKNHTVGSAATLFQTARGVTIGSGGGTIEVYDPTVQIAVSTCTVAIGANTLQVGGNRIWGFAGTMTGTGVLLVKDSATMRVRTSNERFADAIKWNLSTSLATIDFGATLTETIGEISGSGIISTSTGTGSLTISQTTSSTFSGKFNAAGTLAVTKAGSGTLTLSGAAGTAGATSSLTVTAGAIAIGSDTALASMTLKFNGGTVKTDSTTERTVPNPITFPGSAITLGTTATTNLNFTGTFGLGTVSSDITVTGIRAIFRGILSGTASFVKKGTGTLVLSNANTFGSATYTASNTAGTILIDNTSGSGLGVANCTNYSGVTFGGKGSMTGTMDNNGIISPGDPADNNGVGSLTIGVLNYYTGGKYKWEISNTTVSEGVNQDFLNVTGALTFGTGSYTLNITGVGGISFDNTQNYSWRIATAAGGITGFDANNWTLTPSGITVGNGAFRIRQSGSSIYLDFVHPPYVISSSIGQSVDLGNSAAMSVTAGGDAPLTYQWKKDNVNIGGETGSSYTIASVALSDAATYSVEVTGLYTPTATASGILAIHPYITVQPVALTNSPGDTAVFSVTAQGSGTLTYQWKKDGSNVSGATQSSLTFSPVRGTNAAEELGYSVVVANNSDGTVTSTAALFRVTPEFTTTLPATMAASQGDVNMNVYVTGTTNLTYSWYKNATLLADDAKYSGTSTTNLTILSVVEADSGTYSAVASNLVGLATNSTVLTVSVYPAINNQPQSTTKAFNDTATFYVDAVGLPPLYYQWYKDGVAIDTGGNASAGTATLTLSSVSVSDEADYTVVVSNEVASVGYSVTSSPPATLTVIYPLTTTGPGNLTVSSNSTATLTVAITSSHTGSVTYQWRKGASNLSNTGNYTGTGTATLSIANTRTTDNGSYSCVLSNLAGAVTSSSGVLTVINPPAFTVQPVSKTVGIGTNATFTATVVGTSPSYQWYKGATPLVDAAGEIVGATTTTLTVVSPDHADEDSYSLVATNFAAIVTSDTVTLTVQDKPVVTVDPVSVNQDTNLTANFAVTVSGQTLNYQWYKGSSSGALSNGANIAGATLANLTLSTLVLGDAGSYFAIITNIAGKATSAVAVLTVNQAPSVTTEPSDLSTRGGDTTNGVFSVSIVGYPLNYQWYKNGNAISGATVSSYTVNPVQASAFGYYSVIVTNQLGTVTSRNAILSARYTNIWTVAPTDRSYLSATASEQRGIAYNFNSGHILLATRTGGTAVHIINPADGTDASPATMDVSGITAGGTHAISRIGLNNDGIIYACNLNLSSSIAIYRWPDESSGSTIVHNALVGGGISRLGDVIAVTGSDDDNSTHILITGGSGASDTNLVLFTTADNGVSFTPTICHATNQTIAASEFFNGIVWGLGDDFYSKAWNQDKLKHWSINTSNGNIWLLSTIDGFDSSLVGLSYSEISDVLYGVNWSTHKLRIYDTSSDNSKTNSGVFYMPGVNANSASGAGQVVQAGSSTIVGLECNNGLIGIRKQSLPTVSTQPVSSTKSAGQTATFSVTLNQKVVYTQWKRNGSPIAGTTSASANTGTLTLSSVTGDDAGTYTVVAVSTNGPVTSSTATLTVTDDPTITSNPSNVTIGSGTNANFSVSAVGASLTYHWRKGGINLSNGGHFSGATSATLTVNPDVSDSGTYDVVVTSTYGTATSTTATLTAQDLPVISVQPSSVTVNDGATPSFHVTISQGTAVSYQWKKNGSNLSNVGIVSGADTPGLTLTGVTTSDDGSYTVRISNLVGFVDSTSAILDVESITGQPVSVSTNAGSTVVMSATISGNGPLTYQWQKNSVNLVEGATNAAGGAITGVTSTSLTMANVVHDNEGSYRIIATGVSALTSSTATLSVVDPFIVTAPLDVSVNIGGSTSISVVAAGTPYTNGLMRYQWYRKSTNATITAYTKLAGKTNATLSISAAAAVDNGYYYVTVSNLYSRFAYAGTNVAHTATNRVTVNTAPTVSNPANLTKIRGNDAIFRVTATGTTPISYRWKTNGVELADIPGKIIGASTAVLTIKDVQGTDVGVANLPNPSGVLPATVSYQCTVSNASLLTATSSGTMGNLTVTEDTLNPLSLISHPITTYLFRLTNGLSKTTNFVTNPSGDVKTAPDVTIDGLAIDAGRIADVSITQKYYDTNGALVTMSPVSVALYGSLPGFKKWTNDFVLRDGTNIFTAIATDSAGNVQTRLIPKTYFLVRTSLLMVTIVKGDGIGEGTTEPGRLPAAVLGFGQASNLASLEIGRGYQIKAVPSQNCIVTNWTDGGDIVRGTNGSYASLTLTFLMQEGLELKANFMTNPIIAANVAGLYNGVFNEESGGLPAVTEETSGSMLNVTVRTNRLVIAPINIQGRGHTLVGFLNQDGDLTKTIDRSVFGRSNLVVSLHLDWANNTKQMTGTISSTNSAAVPWSASFTNDLAGLYLSQDDRYTLAIPPTATSHLAVPDGTPGGYGYAMITNNALGGMLFTGKAADGTTITQVGPVSKDGKAPIHINLYGVAGVSLTGNPFKGVLHGWLDFTSGAPVGTLNWIKQGSSAFPTNYPDGFTNLNVAVLGSLYDPNAYGSGRALNLSTGTFSVSDCNVGSDTDLTWTFGLSTANVITRTGGPATNSLSGSIVKSLGLMNVTFRPTGLPATGVRSIRGIVLQNTSSGYGAFNGNTNQTGSATLAP